MITCRGKKIYFSGRDLKVLTDAAKKSKVTPEEFLILSLYSHVNRAVLAAGVSKKIYRTKVGKIRRNLKRRISGVQIGTLELPSRREGTD